MRDSRNFNPLFLPKRKLKCYLILVITYLHAEEFFGIRVYFDLIEKITGSSFKRKKIDYFYRNCKDFNNKVH